MPSAILSYCLVNPPQVAKSSVNIESRCCSAAFPEVAKQFALWTQVGPKLPSLFLRVQSRKKTWGIRYLFEGKGESGSSAKRRDHLGVYPGLGLYDARDKARNVLRELERGRDPRAPARRGRPSKS